MLSCPIVSVQKAILSPGVHRGLPRLQ